jgi:hypothetical protein
METFVVNLTSDSLDVQKGERIRATLVGATWAVAASPHTASALEDVGFRVVSLVGALPADADWQQGKVDPPGFPNTLLWGELEAKASASLGRNLTEDLYVARAWSAPSSLASARPLHPYDVIAGEPSVACGRVIAFGVAYVLGRAAA